MFAVMCIKVRFMLNIWTDAMCIGLERVLRENLSFYLFLFLFLTWVVLGEAGQGLGGVHANIVFGEDDLAVQARAQRRSPRRGVKGQEVGGLGGGAPQEPTERHLLRRGDAGSILWGAEDAVMVNDGPTSGNVPGAREERNSNAWTL